MRRSSAPGHCPGRPPQQSRSGSWLSIDDLDAGATRSVTVTVVARDRDGQLAVDAGHTYVELRIDDRRNPERTRFAITVS
jgi:hypothetical protein